jgi:DNA-binding transcriptional ArsR family regulator
MWKQAVREFTDSAVRVAWTQWASLGAPVSQRGSARAIVDPEALVLISLALRHRERRLWDLLGWWAVEGTALLSVQRMKNLVTDYPEGVRDALSEFAELAYRDGGDHRWKTFDRRPPAHAPRPSKLSAGPVQLRGDPTLLVRLRLGFGVGVKADILSLLIGHPEASLTVRELAEITGYTGRAVRRAAEELGRARLIRTRTGQPVEYTLDLPAWLHLLEVEGEPPRWHYWHGIFGLVSHVLEASTVLTERKGSSYVVSSAFRRILTDHDPAFRWNRIRPPDPDQYPGERYL